MERFAGFDLKTIRLAATKKELLKWFEENKVSLPPKNERGNITVKALNEARRQHLQKGKQEETGTSDQSGGGGFDRKKLRGMGENWGVGLRDRDPDPEMVAMAEDMQKLMQAARQEIEDGTFTQADIQEVARQLYESELFGDRQFTSRLEIFKALGRWSKQIDKWKASAKKSEPEPEQSKATEPAKKFEFDRHDMEFAREYAGYFRADSHDPKQGLVAPQDVVVDTFSTERRNAPSMLAALAQEIGIEGLTPDSSYEDFFRTFQGYEKSPEWQKLLAKQDAYDEEKSNEMWAEVDKERAKKKAPWYKRMFGLSADLSVERYASLQRSEIQA